MSPEWKEAISVILGVTIGFGLYYWLASFFQAQLNLVNKRIEGLETLLTSLLAILLSAQQRQKEDQELKNEMEKR